MTIDIDQLKKKIIYRSKYRGTKEMDKLLGLFTSEHIDKITKQDLIDLEKLLDFDDDNLFNFYKGLPTDVDFEENNINFLFKNFNLNKK